MKSSLINLNLSLFSNEAHNQRPGCATELIAVVQLLSRVQLFATPWTVAHQAFLSFTFPTVCSNSCPLSQWCCLILASSALFFSFCLQSFPASGSFQMSQLFTSGGQSTGASISASLLPMNNSGLISFRIDWFDLLEVQVTLKSLLQHHSSKASILQCSAFFIVQLSHLYMTTGKTAALKFDYMDLCWQSNVSAF